MVYPIRSYSIPATLIALAVLINGCLPASGIKHTARASGKDIDAVSVARSDISVGPARRKVLSEAEGWLGTPYRYGGTTRTGVDCSGFVCNVYNAVNVGLPRTSSQQASEGEFVALPQVQPWDLVFFNTTGRGVSHVGIMINGEQFIHASTSSGVIVSSLSEGYYHERLLYARRILP